MPCSGVAPRRSRFAHDEDAPMPAFLRALLLDVRLHLLAVVALFAAWVGLGCPTLRLAGSGRMTTVSPPIPGLANHDPRTCPGCVAGSVR